MIRLSVEDYCHNCPEFEIDIQVDNTTFHGRNMITGDTFTEKQINRTIRCKHKERCQAIANHISEKLSKGEKNMKKIYFWGLMMLSFIAMAFCFSSCGNRNLIDTTYRYEYAYIRLPNGETVEGKVKSWDDYETSDMLQVEIDGKVYLTHSTNVVLVSE